MMEYADYIASWIEIVSNYLEEQWALLSESKRAGTHWA